ncbi:MAG: hypothetical protein CBB62_04370 [Micavibrio sp. TMED2]|nr:MAG: hypothetical protein CBB62_04370 [Micavibrio sp. TMED2]
MSAPQSQPDLEFGAISLRGVTKRFGDVTAVDALDLDIAAGEMFSLLGGSGSGKTTLLRLLAGFEQPDEGSILIDGVDMAGIPAYRRPVNMMFQSYALFPHMSVAANIAYGLHQRKPKPDRATIASEVERALAMVKLDGFGGRKPHQLSGGQRQRVALARAIVKRPKVLLLDEPLGALDKKLREQTQLELIRIQAETDITFIIVTHDQEEAMALSDRIAVMDHGRLKQVGTARQLYEEPADDFVAGFIGSINLFDATVSAINDDCIIADCDGLGQGIRLPKDNLAALPQLTVGSSLRVGIRPECIGIVPVDTPPPDMASGGDWNLVTGNTRDVAFMGDHLRVAVELPDGGVVRAVRHQGDKQAAALEIAAPARLQWLVEDAYWFPAP